MKNNEILIDTKGKRIGGYRTIARRIAANVLNELSIDAPCELSILLVDDDVICELNHTHREVNSPTDVLAFPMKEGFDMPAPPDKRIRRPLGDVVISIETAKRQAIEHNHSIEEEIALLITHGILHLLGYGDETEDELRKISKATRDVLGKIDTASLFIRKSRQRKRAQ